ncbi:MAG: hypothetical protein IJD71_02540 [Clostridia bacterium]|nr:hypothetical protein [Clostridia bacterium]MBQ4131199.1 hypothetical protein [Clostridia bacterium]MBQ9919641.1 hypothetical protein [Clostridia bacterium]
MSYNRKIGKTNMSFSKLTKQCIIRTVLSLFLTLILYLSITFVVTSINYEAIGYDVLYSPDGENFETVYTYMYTGEEPENWVDEKLQEYMNKEGYYKQTIPNQLSKSAMNAVSWVSQILALGVWGALIYIVNWNAGNADADKNELGNASIDKLRGLKAGLLAVTPFAASYLILVVAKLTGAISWAVSLFKILNFNCFAFTNMIITNGVGSISISELICLVAVLLPLPIFAAFGYAMGVRHTVLKDKIVYKNEK